MKKFFPLVIAILVVIFLGTLGRWYYTLSGDVAGSYFPLSSYYWLHGDLSNFVGVSNYPPGANLFFMALPPISLQIYQWCLAAINCLFLLLVAKFTKHPNLLALIVLATGPIILLRFDLLVMLLVILAMITFRQQHFCLSGIFFGVATITKLFPVVLLPYFLLVMFASKRRKIFPWLLSFIFSIFFVFIFYIFLTGQDWRTLILQTDKTLAATVHVESILASVLTIITAVTNPGPHGLEFINARWDISPLYFLGHSRLFKVFSPIFMAMIYGLIVFRYWREKTLRIDVCMLIILTLLVSSQLLSPQYVLWPAMLVTLLAKENLRIGFWRINISLLLLALALTQIIYPLNYGEFLDFYNKGINPHLFLIMTARNISLVILTIRLLVGEKWMRSGQEGPANGVRIFAFILMVKKEFIKKIKNGTS